MLATRLYALLLVLVLLAAAAVEFVPRGPAARSSAKDLRHRIGKLETTEASIAARAGRGEVEEGDDVALEAVRNELRELRNETKLRTIRDGGFVALAFASVLFAIGMGGATLLRQRAPPRSGDVEVEPDEDVAIDPVEAAHELGRLHMTRKSAIDSLLDQPALRCSYCRTWWRPDVLGRIGKRVLVQRPPAGVTAPTRNVLGEGWWVRPAEPAPCVKCGSRDLA